MHRDNTLAISDLESETQIMISMRHRNILRVLGVGKTGGLPVELVSNWVLTGATLARPECCPFASLERSLGGPKPSGGATQSCFGARLKMRPPSPPLSPGRPFLVLEILDSILLSTLPKPAEQAALGAGVRGVGLGSWVELRWVKGRVRVCKWQPRPSQLTYTGVGLGAATQRQGVAAAARVAVRHRAGPACDMQGMSSARARVA